MLIRMSDVDESASIDLLPGRAAMIPSSRTLLVADLHLGKAAAFQRAGLPIPEGSSRDDLARLATIVAATRPKRLIVLGDLFHSARGCTSAVFDEFAEFRADIAAVRLVLVRGNHDRRVRIPDLLGIDEVVESLHEPPWLYVHEPPTPSAGRIAIAGHLHPRVSIGDRSDRLSPRCFAAWAGLLVLPAFGSFTGARAVAVTDSMRVWAAGDEDVVEVTRVAVLPPRRHPPSRA